MRALRKLLYPFSLIYGFVVYLRNSLYNIGVFKSTSYQIPLICIGNLSVGGTGKTPMTEFLISQLKNTFKVAVLSRGYKRKSKGFVLAKEDTKVEVIGDEPFQYHQKFKNIHVAVDADRRNGISELQKSIHPDLILLDDAFQHRKIKAGFNILLTTYDNLYVNDLMLPAGNLRDNKREAKRANIIVVTKCPQNISIEEKEIVIRKIKPKAYQKIFFTTIEYSQQLKSNDKEISLNELKDDPFILVTGIAKPELLVDYLNNKKLSFKHLDFPDHHNFTKNEVEKLKKHGKLVVTTEKDFMRLKNRVENLYYIEIKIKFLFQKENEFNGSIIKYLNEK